MRLIELYDIASCNTSSQDTACGVGKCGEIVRIEESTVDVALAAHAGLDVAGGTGGGGGLEGVGGEGPAFAVADLLAELAFAPAGDAVGVVLSVLLQLLLVWLCWRWDVLLFGFDGQAWIAGIPREMGYRDC